MTSARGSLVWNPARDHLDLLALPVAAARESLAHAHVASIDASLADTAAFCAAYGVALDRSANCVVVAGRRGDVTTYAAVVVLATMRADVNGVVRRELGARRCSFAPMTDVVSLTGMEYGGITPFGLPSEWPILVDDAVVAAREVVVGSGLRSSKLLVDSATLTELPRARAMRLATGPS